MKSRNVRVGKMGHHQTPRCGDSTSFDQEDPFVVGVTERVNTDYTVFVDNEITSEQDFRNIIKVFHTASEQDRVNIILSSPGGSLYGAMAFLQAQEDCHADITYYASGRVASAAAIILCSASKFKIHPHTSILFHSASFGAESRPAIDTEESSVFMRKQCENFISYCCAGVLSREELRQIYENKKEMWMTAGEFTERWYRKAACEESLQKMFDEGVVDPNSITTEEYTEAILSLVDDYDGKDPE